jgi:hypothetical protein
MKEIESNIWLLMKKTNIISYREIVNIIKQTICRLRNDEYKIGLGETEQQLSVQRGKHKFDRELFKKQKQRTRN